MPAVQKSRQCPAHTNQRLHVIDQPVGSDTIEIELNLLRVSAIPKARNNVSAVRAEGASGNVEIRDGPVLSIDPKTEVDAADPSLCPSLVTQKKPFQPRRVDIVRRLPGTRLVLRRDQMLVHSRYERARIIDSRGRLHVMSAAREQQNGNRSRYHRNRPYTTRKSRPVISFGCFSPSTLRMVGAMSCNAPFGRSLPLESSTRMNGTGFVV